MGRPSIYAGIVFAVVGLIGGIYVSSLGPASNLPAPLLFVLCPAAVLADLSATSADDSDFMWLMVIFNSAIYGIIGVFLGRLVHVDNE